MMDIRVTFDAGSARDGDSIRPGGFDFVVAGQQVPVTGMLMKWPIVLNL